MRRFPNALQRVVWRTRLAKARCTVCHTCLSSRGRETSGADAAGGKSEKHDSSGGKGKDPAGTSSGVKLRQPVEAGQSSGAAAPPPPAYSGVAEHFCELEDTAETCGMSEVSYHLRKAKLAWRSAYGSRETKQTCMRDFLLQRWC